MHHYYEDPCTRCGDPTGKCGCDHKTVDAFEAKKPPGVKSTKNGLSKRAKRGAEPMIWSPPKSYRPMGDS